MGHHLEHRGRPAPQGGALTQCGDLWHGVAQYLGVSSVLLGDPNAQAPLKDTLWSVRVRVDKRPDVGVLRKGHLGGGQGLHSSLDFNKPLKLSDFYVWWFVGLNPERYACSAAELHSQHFSNLYFEKGIAKLPKLETCNSLVSVSQQVGLACATTLALSLRGLFLFLVHEVFIPYKF